MMKIAVLHVAAVEAIRVQRGDDKDMAQDDVSFLSNDDAEAQVVDENWMENGGFDGWLREQDIAKLELPDYVSRKFQSNSSMSSQASTAALSSPNTSFDERYNTPQETVSETESKVLYVQNMPTRTMFGSPSSHVKDLCEMFGTVKEMMPLSEKGAVLVEFENVDDAAKCKKWQTDHPPVIGGHELKFSYSSRQTLKPAETKPTVTKVFEPTTDTKLVRKNADMKLVREPFENPVHQFAVAAC